MNKVLMMILACGAFGSISSSMLLENIEGYLQIGSESKDNVAYFPYKSESFSKSPAEKVRIVTDKMASIDYPDKEIFTIFINVVNVIETLTNEYILTQLKEASEDFGQQFTPGKNTVMPQRPAPDSLQKRKAFFESEPDIARFLSSVLHKDNLDKFFLLDTDEEDPWEWTYDTPAMVALNRYFLVATLLSFGLISYKYPRNSFVTSIENRPIATDNIESAYFERLASIFSALKDLFRYGSYLKAAPDLKWAALFLSRDFAMQAAMLQGNTKHLEEEAIALRRLLKQGKKIENRKLVLFVITKGLKTLEPWVDKVEGGSNEKLRLLRKALKENLKEIKADDEKTVLAQSQQALSWKVKAFEKIDFELAHLACFHK